MPSLVIVLLLGGASVSEQALLSLDEALRIARTSNPKIEAARAQLEIARSRLSQATALFLPNVTGGVAYLPQTSNHAPSPGLRRLLSHVSLPGIASVADTAGNVVTTPCLGSPSCTPAPPFSLPPPSYELQTYWSAQLGIFWNVWDWGTTIYGRRAARTNVEAQRWGVVTQQNDVALQVKLAFFNLLSIQAAVKVAEEAVETQQLNLDTAKQQKKVGVAAEVDVATAKADLAQAQLSLVLIQGAISSAQAALALAMGQESWRGYTLEPPPERRDAPPPDQTSAIDQAERARPEPRQLALQADVFREAALAARGQFLPQLIFQGGPGWAGDSVGAVTNVSFSVSLAYPVTGINPFFVRAQMRQAQASRALTLAEEREMRDQVGYQVADAISQLSTAQAALVAVKQYLDAGRERTSLPRRATPSASSTSCSSRRPPSNTSTRSSVK